MDEEKGVTSQRDAYQDFLGEVSSQSPSADERTPSMESPGHEPFDDDIQVNVGMRVKRVRESRGLSREDICRRTDIDMALLEQVEKGTLAPPLGTIIKLAKALDMKMGYFISGEGAQPYTIVRVGDRKVVSRYDSEKAKQYGYEYESLAPRKKNRHMEPFLVTLKPAETGEERSSHDGQEFIYVLEGTMEVRLGDEVHLLYPMDSIYYDSTVPHLVKCHGDEETKILAVLYTEK